MNRLTLLAAGIVGLGTIALWKSSSSPNIIHSSLPNESVSQFSKQFDAVSNNNDLVSIKQSTDIEKRDLENHPRVLQYLQREHDKQRIRRYFENPTAENPQAIYRLIEKIEKEGRVVAFEALSMKLAWLEKNTTAEDFKQKREALINNYRQKAQQAKSTYTPSDTPGFNDYKQAEHSIVQQVQNMQSFPDGMSKQDYLRKRLQEARVQAYNSQNL